MIVRRSFICLRNWRTVTGITAAMVPNSNPSPRGAPCASVHGGVVPRPALALGALALGVLSVSAQISVPGSAREGVAPEADVETDRVTEESEPAPPDAAEDVDDPLASLRAFSPRQRFFPLSEENVDIAGDALPGSLVFGQPGSAGGELGVDAPGSARDNGHAANLFISLMDDAGGVGTVRETAESDTALIQASVDDSMRSLLNGEEDTHERELGWLEEPIIVGMFFVVPVVLLIAGGAILLSARNR